MCHPIHKIRHICISSMILWWNRSNEEFMNAAIAILPWTHHLLLCTTATTPCSPSFSLNSILGNLWPVLWSRDYGLETRVHSSSFCPGLGLETRWPRSQSWSRDLKAQVLAMVSRPEVQGLGLSLETEGHGFFSRVGIFCALTVLVCDQKFCWNLCMLSAMRTWCRCRQSTWFLGVN